MTKYLLMAAGLMLSPLLVVEASASDFQVAVQRKKLDASKVQTRRPNTESEKNETVIYQVTVTNRAFSKESGELEARYVIFVERQELAEQPGTEQTERVRGEAKVEPLKAQGKTTFDTKEFALRDQQLSGKFSGYVGGGRIRAKDSIQGVWVKLYDASGAEVGEYVNPTTLRNRMKWE